MGSTRELSLWRYCPNNRTKLEVDVETVVALPYLNSEIADGVGVFAAGGRFAAASSFSDETPEGALLFDRPGMYPGGRTAVAAVAHDEGEEYSWYFDLLDIAHVLHAVAGRDWSVLPQRDDVQTVGQSPRSELDMWDAGAYPAGHTSRNSGRGPSSVVCAGVIPGRVIPACR